MTIYKRKKRSSNKYGAQKIKTPDGTFDSKGELLRWENLKLMQRAGLISSLRRQVSFELVPTIKRKDGTTQRKAEYIADFVYMDAKTGELVVEDFKGKRTDLYTLKKKIMLWRWGVEIKETSKKDL